MPLKKQKRQGKRESGDLEIRKEINLKLTADNLKPYGFCFLFAFISSSFVFEWP
jgi:hypothetical protein